MGTLWGVGHGLSITVLGAAAFFLKGKLSKQFSILEKASNVVGSIAGISLVLIGLLGIKESLDSSHEEAQASQQTALAVLINGLLHGFSWDGLPSLAPAIAMPSWHGALAFLLSYSVGTVVAMATSAATVGALTSRLSQLSERPDLAKKLSYYSSVLAVAIGVFWIFQALLGR